jgi:hypothetical protein
MKHFTFAFLTTVLASSTLLHADTVEVPWAKVCEVSHGLRLIVTTTNGETTEGYCTSINVDEIALTNDQRVIKVAKTAVAHLAVHRVKGHQLAALWRGLKLHLQDATGLLFSPLAPAGAVMLPGTLAWGAVASPFCLLADFADRLAGENEIKVK